MKLEDQVCTLEQAKRLKELGLKEDILFVHLVGEDGAHEHIGLRTFYMGDHRIQYPAYTVAELGEMLPDEAHTIRLGNKWFSDAMETDMPGGGAPTEAQERAALLIHLIENNLITIEQINK